MIYIFLTLGSILGFYTIFQDDPNQDIQSIAIAINCLCIGYLAGKGKLISWKREE